MKKCFIILMAIFGCLQAGAQSFETAFRLSLPDTLTYKDLQLADFDNDTLLDVLVTAKNQHDEIAFLFFKNDSIKGPLFKNSLVTNLKYTAYELTDVDGDNQIDILLTGGSDVEKSTSVYFNSGEFNFNHEILLSTGGSFVRLRDVDNDGYRELILSGTTGTKAFLDLYKFDSGALKKFDSLALKATAFETGDFNDDLFTDMFISGTTSSGQHQSWFHFSTGSYVFSDTLINNISGTTTMSDVDMDGRLDLVLTGINEIGVASNRIISNPCKGCFEQLPLESILANSTFTGDIDSDGDCDISILGRTAASDTVNLVWRSFTDYDTLSHAHLQYQNFGDINRDGNLDLLEIINTGSALELVVLKNTRVLRNEGPRKPFDPVMAKVFDRLFLYWKKAEDDLTPIHSITCDVIIETSQESLVTGTFDKINRKRLLVNHGNGGTANYFVVKNVGTTDLNFAVQTVDNAYNGSYGVCEGGGGSICSVVEYTKVETCSMAPVELHASKGSALWYSFDQGMLGFGETFNHFVTSPDTLFAYSLAGDAGGCAFIEAFVIETKDTTHVIKAPPLFACQDAQLNLTAEPGWEQVLWSSKERGFISRDLSITYTVTGPDTVSVLQSNEAGCSVRKDLPIRLSVPEVSVEEDAYQILRGEQVQLNASGGVSYLWSPGDGLDNVTVNNPVAHPWQTTEYTVTVTDSLGCMASAKVLVVVEQNAFIPNLFTPNDDGKNDELRAFGLDGVNNFKFSIYNREGSLVYSTSNVSELSGRGWDGTVRGVKQPAGVYYWRVEGENNIGRSLMLNGKNSGSIVLIR